MQRRVSWSHRSLGISLPSVHLTYNETRLTPRQATSPEQLPVTRISVNRGLQCGRDGIEAWMRRSAKVHNQRRLLISDFGACPQSIFCACPLRRNVDCQPILNDYGFSGLPIRGASISIGPRRLSRPFIHAAAPKLICRYCLGHSNPPKDLVKSLLSTILCGSPYSAVTVGRHTQFHKRLTFG